MGHPMVSFTARALIMPTFLSVVAFCRFAVPRSCSASRVSLHLERPKLCLRMRSSPAYHASYVPFVALSPSLFLFLSLYSLRFFRTDVAFSFPRPPVYVSQVLSLSLSLFFLPPSVTVSLSPSLSRFPLCATRERERDR